jgi:putative membrane protein
MWSGMMGWWHNGWANTWGGGPMFGIGHLMWWALLIVGVFLIARWIGGSPRHAEQGGENLALSILKERYARGEIDKAEFDARRRDLE